MSAGVLERILEANEALSRQMDELRGQVGRIDSDKRLQREWYTLAECARLKGVSDSALRQERCLQPLGGAGRKQIAGWWRWHRDAVAEWLGQDDETLRRLYGGPRVRRSA